MAKKKQSTAPEIRNRRASHRYNLLETFEAGIVLTGTEVKSVRLGKAQIADAFGRVEKSQVILYHTHIEEYAFGTYSNHNPTRPRKLLLHKREINRIRGALDKDGQTLVPIRMYLKHGLVKVEVALGVGKKLHDKRQDLKRREHQLEMRRAMRQRIAGVK